MLAVWIGTGLVVAAFFQHRGVIRAAKRAQIEAVITHREELRRLPFDTD